MKLTTRNNLNFLSITLFIFMFGIGFFYYFLRSQVDQNINYELKKRKVDIVMQIEGLQDSTAFSYLDIRAIIKPTNQSTDTPELITDTILHDHFADRLLPYRKISFVTKVHEQNYFIEVYKSLEESDMLIVRLLIVNILIIILMIAGLFILNNITSRNVWKTFYNTVNQLNKYDLHAQESLKLSESEIREFQDLNKVLLKMTDKIQNDYFKLKEFTENASHEIQNPLAIINSKMELLLQSENLEEHQFKAVADTYEASIRLSKLNKTLLLLTKIENRQFPDTQKINLKQAIEQSLEHFEDMLENKEIKISKEVDSNIDIFINPYLSEILFSNLIKNAIRHNIFQGEIKIFGKNNSISISNSGPKTDINPEHIFERFSKSSNSQNSIGLGLALVKKICDISDFEVQYQYENELHIFTISNI